MFGGYDQRNLRNHIIIEGLKKNNIKVIECNTEIWGTTSEKIKSVQRSWINIKLLFSVLIGAGRLLAKYLRVEKHDVIVIGYPGFFDVFLIKPIAFLLRKPILLDCFLSLYDTTVVDRKLVKPSSLKAKLIYIVEKYACRLSDIVLLDTYEHIKYFQEEYDLPGNKFRRLFVGVGDPNFISNMEGEKRNLFEVTYFGGFTPLHGVQYVIKAAEKLQIYPDISIRMIGKGQHLHLAKGIIKELKLHNVSITEGWFNPKDLAYQLASADILLGIFGTTPKASRVIPHKVFVALAMGKPVITGDSPAARELLKDKENCVLCQMGDHNSLAEAIIQLKNDDQLRHKIAINGKRLYQMKFSDEILGQQLKFMLENIKNKNNEDAYQE